METGEQKSRVWEEENKCMKGKKEQKYEYVLSVNCKLHLVKSMNIMSSMNK